MLAEELLAFYRQICPQILTIVDVETTGHSPQSARVIEVSVLQANLADGILAHRTELMNPQVPIPAWICQLTGISSAMVAQAPLPEQVWPNLCPMLEQGIFTAHNLSFDYGFIQAELASQGVEFQRSPTQQFCTVKLSRLLLSELPSRSLPALVEHFGFAVATSHRAAADTLACWQLAQNLLYRIQNDSDQELLDRFAQEWLSLEKVARMLKSDILHAWNQLDQRRTPWRRDRRRNTYLFPRSAVERLVLANRDGSP